MIVFYMLKIICFTKVSKFEFSWILKKKVFLTVRSLNGCNTTEFHFGLSIVFDIHKWCRVEDEIIAGDTKLYSIIEMQEFNVQIEKVQSRAEQKNQW